MTEGYPYRARFAQLSAQEKRFGLFDCPEAIGHRDQWLELLDRQGVRLSGHRLVRLERSS